MKTILLIAALIGLTSTGAFACDKGCACKHKIHQKAVRTTEDNTIHTTLLLAPVKDEEQQPCLTFKKDDMIITACPISSDNAGFTNMKIEGTYMGNYPVVCTPKRAADGSVVLDCEPKCTPMENRETGAPLDNPPVGPYDFSR